MEPAANRQKEQVLHLNRIHAALSKRQTTGTLEFYRYDCLAGRKNA